MQDNKTDLISIFDFKNTQMFEPNQEDQQQDQVKIYFSEFF